MPSIEKILQKGYKQSEVGQIPSDWLVVLLGEKTEKVGSGITPTGGSNVYRLSGRPFVRSQNVDWGFLSLNDIAFIDEVTHSAFSSTEIQDNDVLLNITGASIGRAAVADERIVGGNVNQHVCIIRTKKQELNPNFLKYFLLSFKGQSQIESFQAGGNRQGLNFQQIKSLLIPIPPLHKEQAAIASTIADTDALIENLEKIIAKKKAIKQGTMQELLTGKRRLPGFSGKWEKITLGQVLRIKHGKSQKNVIAVNGRYPILASGGEIGRADVFLYNRPSVLIGRKGTIDVPQYMDKPFWTVDTLFYSEINERNEEKFIFYKFQLIDWYLYNEASGVPSLKAKTIERIEANFPPTKSEQTSIVIILSELDAEIEELELKLRKYRSIKTGMMQQLLTGKIRLI